jgi:hypothetical protein
MLATRVDGGLSGKLRTDLQHQLADAGDGLGLGAVETVLHHGGEDERSELQLGSLLKCLSAGLVDGPGGAGDGGGVIFRHGKRNADEGRWGVVSLQEVTPASVRQRCFGDENDLGVFRIRKK